MRTRPRTVVSGDIRCDSPGSVKTSPWRTCPPSAREPCRLPADARRPATGDRERLSCGWTRQMAPEQGLYLAFLAVCDSVVGADVPTLLAPNGRRSGVLPVGHR